MPRRKYKIQHPVRCFTLGCNDNCKTDVFLSNLYDFHNPLFRAGYRTRGRERLGLTRRNCWA